MLETITKGNFQQLLGKFSTNELENLVEKFPYFQQAHLLLAKKYQQENNRKFDEQLQLAALYAQDKELFFSIFHEKPNAPAFESKSIDLIQEPAKADLDKDVIAEAIEAVPATPVEEIVSEREPDEVLLKEEPVEVLSQEETVEVVQEVVLPVEVATTETQIDEVVVQNITEPRTFDEWLTVFKYSTPLKIVFTPEEFPQDTARQDEELEKLIQSGRSVSYLHNLVEDETHYSKNLDKFIEEQKQKHKQEEKTVLPSADENQIGVEMITETMAKVYEMQKKYSKAIRAYEVLTLKYPEKSDLFAARINYLKNII